MGKLIITENITLDGVIDAAEGWFGPGADNAESDQTDMLAANQRFRDSSVALLAGRVTFEAFREYWPAQTDDETGISDYLSGVEKYVVSSTIDDPQWEHTTVIDGPIVPSIEALKRDVAGDITVTGSMQLATALVAANLVDEYRLFVYPVVVGRGQRLFADATGVPRLELLESERFRCGVTLLRYAVAGGA